jgi:hypothetical protein
MTTPRLHVLLHALHGAARQPRSSLPGSAMDIRRVNAIGAALVMVMVISMATPRAVSSFRRMRSVRSGSPTELADQLHQTVHVDIDHWRRE